MIKEMKRKVFALLLAFAMVFTLMPLAAFAEEPGGGGAAGAGGNTASSRLYIGMYGETSSNIIPQEKAEQARFKLEKEELPQPLSIDGSAGDAESVKLYFEGEKSYIDLTGYSYGRYHLSEIEAPTDCSLSKNTHTIEFKEGGIFQIINGKEYAPITDAGLEFYHDELIKIQVPIRKIVESVGAAAPADAKFTAKLSAVKYNQAENKFEDQTLLGTSEEFGATQGTDTQLLTFSIDSVYTDGWYYFLEETNAGKAGWTYDSQVYLLRLAPKCMAYGAEQAYSQDYEVTILKKPDNIEPGVEPEYVDVAKFTNIYTATGGGGGSHTKYYNIKVNGGKALSVLGSEVTRASSGSVIDVQADDPAEGKVFKGWEVVHGGINAGETSEFSFIMPRADVELTAVYEDTAVEEPVIEKPEDPAEPEQPDENVEEQPEEKDETPVPKTGDAMTMELLLFAVLAAGAAFGMRKAYNKTK